MDALTACDPLPLVTALLETLQKGQDGSDAIAEHGVRLRNVFKQARVAAQAIEHADLSTQDQAEIIEVLTLRVKRKEALAKRLSDAVVASRQSATAADSATATKTEPQDVVMTGD